MLNYKSRLFSVLVICLGCFLAIRYGEMQNSAFQLASQPTTQCPELVSAALQSVTQICDGTGRNQICYGHRRLQVTPFTPNIPLTFSGEGDLLSVSSVRALRGSPLNIEEGIWGLAMMRLQANLPDALPGQNITFLIMGDVELEDAVISSPNTIDARSFRPTSVHTAPDERSPILNTLDSDQPLLITGRNTEGTWLRIYSGAEQSITGWIPTSEITAPSRDPLTAEEIDPASTKPSYGPLQAFRFRSGFTGPVCDNVSPDGLLIQSPHDAGRVMLRINDVDLEIGSTVFLQATASGNMTVTTIEGMAQVTSAESTQFAVAGSRVTVPLDDAGNPAGPPSPPQPYTVEELQHLPLQLLDEPVEIAPPLTEAEALQIAQLTSTTGEICGFGSLPPCVSLVIEGQIQAIDADTITVNDILVALAPNDPLRQLLVVGLMVRVEGNLDTVHMWVQPTTIAILTELQPAPNSTTPPNQPANPGGSNNNPGGGSPGGSNGSPSNGNGGGNNGGNNGMGNGNGMGNNGGGMGNNGGSSGNGMGNSGMGDNGMGGGMGMGNNDGNGSGMGSSGMGDNGMGGGMGMGG